MLLDLILPGDSLLIVGAVMVVSFIPVLLKVRQSRRAA